VLRWVLRKEDNYEFIHILLETRIVVEPAIAEWAAQRATASDLVNLESALNDMDRHYEDKDAFQLGRCPIPSGVDYIGPQFCHRATRGSHQHVATAVFDVTYFSDNTTREVTINQHRTLYDAIRLKNPKQARRISAIMIEGVEGRIKAKFSR